MEKITLIFTSKDHVVLDNAITKVIRVLDSINVGTVITVEKVTVDGFTRKVQLTNITDKTIRTLTGIDFSKDVNVQVHTSS